MPSKFVRVILLVIGISSTPTVAQPSDVKPFYKGATMKFLVPYAAGRIL